MHAFSQPWKVKENFKIAFLNDYSDYICDTILKAGKFYIQGFTKENSSVKAFDYEMSETSQKAGYFNKYNEEGKIIFSLLFEDGTAKKLSVNFADSTLGKYTLENNLLDGVHTSYYSNGNIKEYGYYRQNAPTGEWRFYNEVGKVIAEGSYCGDFKKLLYNNQTKRLITLNQYLDTIKSELLTQQKLENLKKELKQSWGVNFPVNLPCMTGQWKFYDDRGKLIKKVVY